MIKLIDKDKYRLKKIFNDRGLLVWQYICKKVHYDGISIIDGEYISYYDNGIISNRCFCRNSSCVGTDTFYNKDGSIKLVKFYSFEKPIKLIEESEYKIELAKIRLGLLYVPEFELKISDYEL